MNLQELLQEAFLLQLPNPLSQEVHLQPTKMCNIVRRRKCTLE